MTKCVGGSDCLQLSRALWLACGQLIGAMGLIRPSMWPWNRVGKLYNRLMTPVVFLYVCNNSSAVLKADGAANGRPLFDGLLVRAPARCPQLLVNCYSVDSLMFARIHAEAEQIIRHPHRREATTY